MTKLPPITLYRFNFYLKAEEDLMLPEFKGSMFRGVFGITFKKIVCITKQPGCTGCMLQQQCSYFKIFETEMHPNSLTCLKGVKKVPHPFVIIPPPERDRFYPAGSVLTVGLTLFGDSINYLPFFVYTFKQMGATGISYKRSKVTLERVTNVRSDDSETEVYSAAAGQLLMQYEPVVLQAQNAALPYAESITLAFITPVRLQENGKVLGAREQVTPAILLDTVYRRYLFIAYLFCGGTAESVRVPEFTCEGITITENKLMFIKIDRFSNRQARKVPMDGFTGSITLQGNIGAFIPLLYAGQFLHMGKNTVFGMGRYRLQQVI